MQNLYVRAGTPSTDSDQVVYTVRINGAASSITVTMAGTASTGSDTSNTESVSAGDDVDIEITKAVSVSPAVEEVTVTLELA